MKSTQTLNELRTMDIPELDARLKEVRTELFNLRFQAATGQLENHRQIRNVRHQIAQVLTVMQGRRLGIEDIVSADVAAATPAPARGADRAQAAAAAATAAEEEAELEATDADEAAPIEAEATTAEAEAAATEAEAATTEASDSGAAEPTEASDSDAADTTEAAADSGPVETSEEKK
jgi:large subunit ribosomal protein L29